MTDAELLEIINNQLHTHYDIIVQKDPEWRGYQVYACWYSNINAEDGDVGVPKRVLVKDGQVERANEQQIIEDIVKGLYKI